MSDLPKRLHKLYLSEGYNAVAILTKEEVCDIPYLDKFSISQSTQVKTTSGNCNMTKRDESDVADIVFEILAKKEVNFFCFILF